MRWRNTKRHQEQDDNFFGILNGLSNNNLIDLIQSGLIQITASSDNGNIPNNVLKNDNSYWISNNVQNSWIQFDFKSTVISLVSYSLRSAYEPKSWKIEGSNDSINFTLIDQRSNNTNDFKHGQYIEKHYHVNGSQDKFRYIRITQGDDGRVANDHYFYLYRVEFFGDLYDQNQN